MRSGGGGGGGQYDLVSASGDASLRLIYGGDVQPVNVNLIPAGRTSCPPSSRRAHNTVNGRALRVSLQWGPNTLHLQHEESEARSDELERDLPSKYKGKITVPNNPIQIADAALYLLKTKPSLGITDPYELTKTQFDAAVRCSSSRSR